MVLDFSTSTASLDKLYLWNVKEGTATGAQIRGAQTFNIWYTNSPTTTIPGSGSYNFSTAGWTQLGGTNTLAKGTTNALDGTYDLTGIPNARYIAIEILTNYGSTASSAGDNNANRVGLAEIVVTSVIPEPTTALLSSLAALGLLRRRRVS